MSYLRAGRSSSPPSRAERERRGRRRLLLIEATIMSFAAPRNSAIAPHSPRPTVTDVRTPVSRAFVIVLAVAILLHAALLAPAVLKALAATPPPDYDILEAAGIAAAGLAASAILFIGWRQHLRGATVLVLVLVASVLLTPGAVLLVALMLANAYLVGRAVLRWLASDTTGDRVVPWTVALLTGYSLWIGAMAATAGLKVHFLPVYVAALALPLIHWRTELRVACVSLWQALSRPSLLGGTEVAWLALLTAVVLVHLFVVAKPEVGYDATAVHLQFAQLLANRHRWDFDVTRYAWADMPLGADLSFAAAYILGGEAAARTLNFAFGVLACQLVYQLIRRHAQSEIALASVCLLASMPLAYLETGTLFVENLWIAFLLAALLTAIDYAHTREPPTLAACALLAAGALQTKVIGVLWLIPLGVATLAVALRGRREGFIGWRCLTVIAGALVIAAWPYANAWVRTGNPVFPFLNDLFRSPYFDATKAFTNPMYETPLRWTSLHDLFLSSGRYIEGSDGAAGWHWLLLLAVIAVVFLFRRRPAMQWLCAGLAAIFFVGVFSQQAYLRYLLPFLMLTAVLGGWALGEVVGSRPARFTLLALGAMLCLLNLRFIYAGYWFNQALCLRCAVEDSSRMLYLSRYAPDRIIADYLSLSLPDARVGFFALRAAGGSSGFVGYSRAASWHDAPVYAALLRATTAEDVLALARQYRLTHVVVWEPVWDIPAGPMGSAISAFRDRYTTPMWRFGGRLLAAIRYD
jgi:hypothetical protein